MTNDDIRAAVLATITEKDRRITELENLRDHVCLLHETATRELAEAKAEIARLREGRNES